MRKECGNQARSKRAKANVCRVTDSRQILKQQTNGLGDVVEKTDWGGRRYVPLRAEPLYILRYPLTGLKEQW